MRPGSLLPYCQNPPWHRFLSQSHLNSIFKYSYVQFQVPQVGYRQRFSEETLYA